MRVSLVAFLFMIPWALQAQPKLHLLNDQEWKGACRKVVNEAGQEVKNQTFRSLQSSYRFQNGDLIWWVKSFSDKGCAKIHAGDKYTLECEFKDKAQYADCVQTLWDTSQDGQTWQSKPMVDHAGNPNILKLKVKVGAAQKNKLKLTKVGESEDEESEILAHSSP